MFRVPHDPMAPTFDNTFKVSFWRFLTSSAAERREWGRRRNAAARLAASNQRQRARDQRQRLNAQYEQRRSEHQKLRAPRPAPVQDPQLRSLQRWDRVAAWETRLLAAEFWIYVLLVGLPVLAVCGCCGYVLFRFYQ